MTADKSGMTAITRKTGSVPTRWLHKKGFLGKGTMILDYGCGKGADIDYLREYDYWVAGYDPNHRTVDDDILECCGRCSDYIICQYVLNTVDHNVQAGIINKISGLLKPYAKAYITVRRDIKKEGLTKRGTYQENVVLNLPVVRETSTYCIYKLEK